MDGKTDNQMERFADLLARKVEPLIENNQHTTARAIAAVSAAARQCVAPVPTAPAAAHHDGTTGTSYVSGGAAPADVRDERIRQLEDAVRWAATNCAQGMSIIVFTKELRRRAGL